jgi:adenylate cyclase
MAHGSESQDDFLTEPRLMISIQEGNKPIKTKIIDTSIERTFLIGRNKDCHIRMKDKTSSMTHAALVYEKDGFWTINDLGSTNGTYLNEKIVGRTGLKIRSGDMISIGFQNVIVHRCI